MNQSPAVQDDEVIACLLSERKAAVRGEELAGGLFAAVDEVAEFPDGYAYRFPSDGSLRGSPPVKAFIAEAFHSRIS